MSFKIYHFYSKVIFWIFTLDVKHANLYLMADTQEKVVSNSLCSSCDKDDENDLSHIILSKDATQSLNNT